MLYALCGEVLNMRKMLVALIVLAAACEKPASVTPVAKDGSQAVAVPKPKAHPQPRILAKAEKSKKTARAATAKRARPDADEQATSSESPPIPLNQTPPSASY